VAASHVARDARSARVVADAALPSDAIDYTAASRDYKHLVDQYAAAAAAANDHDGKRCTALLAEVLPRQAELGPSSVDDLISLRAQCAMASGDCDTGRDLYADYLRLNGIAEADRPAGVDDFDMRWCTISGPGTAAQREKRARWRLQLAIGTRAPCADLAAEADAAHIASSDPKFHWFAAECLAAAGECAAAQAHMVNAGDFRATVEQKYPDCATITP
jgi:hypothetical protein